MKRLRSCFARMALCGAAVLALGFLDGIICGRSAVLSAAGLMVCVGMAALSKAGEASLGEQGPCKGRPQAGESPASGNGLLLRRWG